MQTNNTTRIVKNITITRQRLVVTEKMRVTTFAGVVWGGGWGGGGGGGGQQCVCEYVMEYGRIYTHYAVEVTHKKMKKKSHPECQLHVQIDTS